MNKVACPSCGAASLRAGAVKCPACQAWVRPKPPAALGALGVALTVAGLAGSGLAIGGAAVFLAARGATSRAEPAAPGAPGGNGSASGSASAPPSATAEAGAAPPAPGPPVTFAEPRLIRISGAPLDAVVSDDDASLFVLGDDGAVRVHDLASGKELRKVAVPGKGTELRLLGGKLLAVMGASGPVPIVELGTFNVGKVDLGGAAVDAVALGDTPSFVVASASSRKIARFSLEGARPEGQVVLARPVSGLVLTRGGGREMLAALTPGKAGSGPGTVELFEPTATPFGASRSSWIAAVDPRRGAPGEGSLLVVDRGGSQLLEVAVDRPLRIANVGQHPLSAHRLLGRWVVTVDAAGTATVLAEGTLEPRATIPLGAGPSDAVVTPDGRALLIALGGGSRDRGATTAVVAGDPPAVVAKLTTGPGSHTVRIGKRGRFAAVAAYFGRTVAILERR